MGVTLWLLTVLPGVLSVLPGDAELIPGDVDLTPLDGVVGVTPADPVVGVMPVEGDVGVTDPVGAAEGVVVVVPGVLTVPPAAGADTDPLTPEPALAPVAA